MGVSIEDIKKLRDATGISMTMCKKALEEGGGDYDKAVEVLRKSGAAKAAKRADNETENGAVFVKTENGKTAILKLLCETDFVAKSNEFLEVAEELADKLISGDLTEDDKESDVVKEAIVRLGENIRVGEMKLIVSDNVGSYVHSNGKIGVVVSLSKGDSEVAKEVAMHAAATNPAVLSPDEISDDLVAKEKEIWTEQLTNEGKPAEIMEKIMIGKEKKFREENALLKQAFVKNPDKTIEELVDEAGAVIESFIRFQV